MPVQPLDEPFARLLTQGMVCKETYRCPDHDYLYPEEVTAEKTCKHCGKPVTVGRIEKMSKSLKNVVEPLPLIEKYGADTVRIFSLFAAPPESVLEWSDAGVEGAWRFLNRVWRLVTEKPFGKNDAVEQKKHATIKKVREDFERFHFNTAIAAIMELVNAITAEGVRDRDAVETVVRLLSPMAPHICEELWQKLGHDELLVTKPWPEFDADKAQKKRVPFPVQVNGKLRGQVEAEPDADQERIEREARALASVQPFLAGKEVKKVIFVKGRLINFVVV
jgi:leucyl-tRNA synthetase